MRHKRPGAGDQTGGKNTKTGSKRRNTSQTKKLQNKAGNRALPNPKL